MTLFNKETTFSLALGGWAARGLAHIGVIRELERRGMKPGHIAWTSIGAIIGWLMALGKTSYEAEKILDELNFLSLVDLDMREWLLKWKKIEQFLETIFEQKSFSDVLIPFVVTATDINTWETIAIKEWKLSEAIRASISLPGIFRPLSLFERELVDGGLAQNLPIELLPEGPVIAISALRSLERKIVKSRKLFSFDIKKTLIGNWYSLLQKTIDILLWQNEERSLRSRNDIIFIRPAFDKLDYYEFHKYKEFIKAWEKKAQEVLNNLQNN